MLMRRVSTPIRAIIKSVVLGCLIVASGVIATKVASVRHQQRLDSRVWLAADDNHVNDLMSALKAGGSPDACDSGNASGLTLAAYYGNTRCVALLLNCKANPNIQDAEAKTPLISAIDNNHSDIAALLLEHGADPNLADIYGYTPLLIAIKQNDGNIFRKLLAAGANPRQANKQGETPLSWAEGWKHFGMANLLRKAGASQ